MNYIVYRAPTGEILKTGTCPSGSFSAQAGGESVMEGVAVDTLHYVVDGMVADRPTMGVAIDKTAVAAGETATISGIPAGTQADVDGELATVDDGVMEITFDTNGSYPVRLRRFPYKDYEVTIQCG